MPTKLTAADFRHLVDRYRAGEPIRDLAAEYGVSEPGVYARMRREGVARRSARDARRLVVERTPEPEHVAEIVRRYRGGETQGEIAAALGMTQTNVSLWLQRKGETVDRGEAMRRRHARMTPAERRALAASANEAARGRTPTTAEREQRARTRQRDMLGATPAEFDLCLALYAYGPVMQQAVGPYNIDVACSPVAVELFGGGWHARGRHAERLPQRTEHLADAGWNLYIAWSHIIPLDLDAVAQDAAAYIEQSRRDPAFRRRYRVVRGDGQLLAAGSVDDDEVTLIPTGVRGAYRRA